MKRNRIFYLLLLDGCKLLGFSPPCFAPPVARSAAPVVASLRRQERSNPPCWLPSVCQSLLLPSDSRAPVRRGCKLPLAGWLLPSDSSAPKEPTSPCFAGEQLTSKGSCLPKAGAEEPLSKAFGDSQL